MLANSAGAESLEEVLSALLTDFSCCAKPPSDAETTASNLLCLQSSPSLKIWKAVAKTFSVLALDCVFFIFLFSLCICVCV